MKLYTGLLIVNLLVANSVCAQRANVGMKGGINFYNIYDNYGGFATKTGFHAGLLWHIHMGQNFAFQPEAVYSLQGADLPDERLHLGYLNVPFLFQFMFNNGFRLEAGPQLGFLMHARSEFNDGFSENVTNSFKPFDAALAAGFGFIGPSGLGFDVRYNHGLSRINEFGTSFANGGFQVGLFYQFQH